MDVTPSTLYWITRLDAIHGAVSGGVDPEGRVRPRDGSGRRALPHDAD